MQRVSEVISQVDSISPYCKNDVSYKYDVVSPQYPTYVSYDANKDGDMMTVISNLMDSYCPGSTNT